VAPVARYYAEKLSAHGVTPQGVDWNSDESQQLRFDQLLLVMDDEARADPPTVLDYGCGYGALALRLIAGGAPFHYIGFDVCTPMVQQARVDLGDPRCVFTDKEGELPSVDYTLASGIFNVRLEASREQWQAHVLKTIDTLAEHSGRGFAFNMLTRYADAQKLRDYLYYADPGEYFRLCKERYSRNVSLLHDYDLYEFTIVVRLNSEPKSLLQP
jgi:SAM-dependent methyltransferase